ALLGRELPGDVAGEAVGFGLAWLAAHGDLGEAGFVLAPLLGRELPGDVAGEAVGFGLAWLAAHGDLVEAQHVLQSLLARELGDEDGEAAVGLAMAWMNLHGREPGAQFVLGRLLLRELGVVRRQVVVDMALVWIAHNGVGSDFVSKYVARQRLMTETVAAATVMWASKNPDDEDVWWRLSPILRDLRKWPHLLMPLLTAVERATWTLSSENLSARNSKSEIDGLMDQLCRRRGLKYGIPAARLDDVLVLWLHRPESLSPHCSPGSYYLDMLFRVTSFVIVPGRFPGDPQHLLDRLEAWIENWQCAGEQRDEARSHVARTRIYLSRR
ncbi:hypothetical protein, partial [Lentzea sp. NPDC051838]|uniref:hypothetical protein n=1 Tax=Lentzea sp. NPDC051838 TaxID=3154849 RepID=UPI00341F6024